MHPVKNGNLLYKQSALKENRWQKYAINSVVAVSSWFPMTIIMLETFIQKAGLS